MNLKTFASIAEQARVGWPEDAAKELLRRSTEDDQLVIERLMDAALWEDQSIQDFESYPPVLIEGDWGRFWFAPVQFGKALLPPAPRITPGGLKALGQGLVWILSGERGTALQKGGGMNEK